MNLKNGTVLVAGIFAVVLTGCSVAPGRGNDTRHFEASKDSQGRNSIETQGQEKISEAGSGNEPMDNLYAALNPRQPVESTVSGKIYSESLRFYEEGAKEASYYWFLSTQQIFDQIPPEQMYIAAIRFYEMGAKDTSVYWFYQAQYRARLFQDSLDSSKVLVGSKAFSLKQRYVGLNQSAGVYINGYAGCDPDKWSSVIEQVRKTNDKVPDLSQIFPRVAFLPSEEWPDINRTVNNGYSKMLNYINSNKSNWKSMRAENDMDARYCAQ